VVQTPNMHKTPSWQMAASLEMLNCNISAMVQLITMKVGSVMHMTALNFTFTTWPWTNINVTASCCALTLQIKFRYFPF